MEPLAAVEEPALAPHPKFTRLHAFESYLHLQDERAQKKQLPSVDLYTSEHEPPPQVYSLNSLPPPALITKIVDAFYNCSGVLFYIVPREDCLQWFRSLYWGKAKRTKAALAELCAVVAVGSQYDIEGITEEFKNACFNTVKLYVDEVLETNELSAMRMYACCAMYSIMEKQIAAWSYVAFGLKIAHSHGLHQNDCPSHMNIREWISYRKSWRSLKFIESWLASSLGRIPDYDFIPCSEDIDIYLEDKPTLTTAFDPNALQAELGKIGFLTADILQHVYTNEKLSIQLIGKHMSKLEVWLQGIPQFMRLETLLANSADCPAPRSIFIIHLMYLGSVILSTRKVFVEWASMPSGEDWKCDGTQEEAYHYINMGVSAAKHISRIIAMLQDNQCLMKRCWLVIHQTFSACLMLLSHIVQMKRHKQPRLQYTEEIRAVYKLLQALQYFATNDRLSDCYLKILEPYALSLGNGEPELIGLSQALRDIRCMHQLPTKSIIRTAGPTPPSSSDEDSTPDPRPTPPVSFKLDQISQGLLDILSKPFGGSACIERGSQMPVYAEDNHARFWSHGGFDIPAWKTPQPQPPLSIPTIRVDKRSLDVEFEAKRVRACRSGENFFRRAT